MGYERDAMLVVRAELCDRLESLRAVAPYAARRDFDERVEGMRSLAAAYGLNPVARLAEALERAVGESGGVRACPTELYFSRLQDAIGCEVLDERASEAMLASVSVRLSG